MLPQDPSPSLALFCLTIEHCCAAAATSDKSKSPGFIRRGAAGGVLLVTCSAPRTRRMWRVAAALVLAIVTAARAAQCVFRADASGSSWSLSPNWQAPSTRQGVGVVHQGHAIHLAGLDAPGFGHVHPAAVPGAGNRLLGEAGCGWSPASAPAWDRNLHVRTTMHYCPALACVRVRAAYKRGRELRALESGVAAMSFHSCLWFGSIKDIADSITHLAACCCGCGARGPDASLLRRRARFCFGHSQTSLRASHTFSRTNIPILNAWLGS